MRRKCLWHSDKDGPLDLNELQQRVKHSKDTEGCLLKMEETSLWIKLKSDWYFEQSKSSMKLPNKERELWKMVRRSANFCCLILNTCFRFWTERLMICCHSFRLK